MKTFDKKIYLKSFFITTLFCLCLSAGCTQTFKNEYYIENVPADKNPNLIKNFDSDFISYQKPLTIGSKKILVALANRDIEYSQGLSDRGQMEENEGMLFDFVDSGLAAPQFWMKGMKFDLDIIWIKNNRIIGIAKNVPHPKTENETLPLYSPPGDIDMVLEVTSGFSEKNNLKIGDEVK